jgi:hypothetical protein
MAGEEELLVSGLQVSGDFSEARAEQDIGVRAVLSIRPKKRGEGAYERLARKRFDRFLGCDPSSMQADRAIVR